MLRWYKGLERRAGGRVRVTGVDVDEVRVGSPGTVLVEGEELIEIEGWMHESMNNGIIKIT